MGLDGATFDLIGPLMAQGKLPNLSRIASKGVHGKLYSTILPLSPTAWTSFSTGKNPGKHGIYDFSKRQSDSYEYVPTTSLDSKSENLWDLVGRFSERSSIVVNVPLTYPPSPLRGVMISGFPTPVSRRDYTYPEELLPALEERFGEIRIHKPTVLYSRGKEQEITNALIDATRQQTEITRYLMEFVDDWALTVSVYDATDVLGHYFWAFLDPQHPKYDPKLAGPVRQMVEQIHIELDRAIGELSEAAGQDSLNLVISDHGFGPVYHGVYVNNWLLEKGYMNFKRSRAVTAKYWAYRHGLHTYNILRIVEKLKLVKSIESAYATRSTMLRLLRKTALSMDDIDWERTRVYSFGNLGQLYLNVKGREPNGIVEPEDSQALIRKLTEEIKGLEDPTTHRRMFDHVYSKSDIFFGEESPNSPDVVFFDEDMTYSAHRMFELGSNKLVTLHPIYSGNHRMDGILFMEGPGVDPSPATFQSKAELIDLAPTILRYLHNTIPEDIDGRVLYELFSDEGGDEKRRAERIGEEERLKVLQKPQQQQQKQQRRNKSEAAEAKNKNSESSEASRIELGIKNLRSRSAL